MSIPPAGGDSGFTPKLHVADELHRTLSPEAIRDAIAMRNTTDVKCVMCHTMIPATSNEQVNLITSVGGLGETVIQFVHNRCAPSGPTGRLAVRNRDPTTTVLIGEREHPTAPGMLLSESSSQITIEGLGSLELAGWRPLGLQASAAGVLAVDGPVLDSLTLTLVDSTVAVQLTDRGLEQLIRVNHANDPAMRDPPVRARLRDYDLLDISRFDRDARNQWRQAVERTGRCLLVVGDSLGLEYPNLERIDMLLAEGKALAGVAPLR